jgi:dipeptidyl aminopeptidase/acylaminoacyl peptidase
MLTDRNSEPHTRYHRYLRLAAFAALSGILAYLVISTGLAWIYAYFLTHPFCRAQPEPHPNLPKPEEYWLKTRDGLSLRTWYFPSQNGAAILVLGGMDGALGDSLPPVDFLVSEGYGVMQIDSRACARPSAPVTLGAKELYDAEAGLAFLLNRPEVKEIGIFGFSMGAAAAIRTAARHAEIAAVVAEGGYYNLGDDIIEPESQLTIPHRAFLYTIAGSYWLLTGVNPWEASPIDDLPAISPRPILLIYGEDEAVSGRAVAQYEAAREPKTLWIVPGGAHGMNNAASPGEYHRRVIEFFRTAFVH